MKEPGDDEGSDADQQFGDGVEDQRRDTQKATDGIDPFPAKPASDEQPHHKDGDDDGEDRGDYAERGKGQANPNDLVAEAAKAGEEKE